MAGLRDIASNLDPVVAIAPAANRTATTTGSTVDLRGYNSAMAVVHYGVITDGTWTASLEESDDDSTYTAVAAADLIGAFTTAGSATDLTTQKVGYRGDARYIRVVVTETTASSTGALFSAVVVKGHPNQAAV
jgi:hypothetical protein